MQFAGISYLAVVVAAVAGFFFGFAWYSVLGKKWMAATGKSEEVLKEGGMMGPLIVSGVAQLVIAFMLAGIMGHLGASQMNAQGGLISGAFVWFGFILTTLSVSYSWQRAKPGLTIIDGLHWLGVMLVQGLVIGAMGV